jgi:hypothetical protein
VGIVRNPIVSLAIGTCTEEGIYDSVAHAQTAVITRYIVGVLRGQRVESVRCERGETTRLVGAKTNTKKATHSTRCTSTTGTLRPSTDLGRKCCRTDNGSDNGQRMHGNDNGHTQETNGSVGSTHSGA